MPSHRSSRAARLTLVAACLLSLGTVAASAHAQSIGYQVNKLEPAPAGDPFAVVESPWYASTRSWAAGLSLDYVHDLLLLRTRGASGDVVTTAPVANQFVGRLELAASPFDRVAVTLSAPLAIQDGNSAADIGASGVFAGDPRIGIRTRLYGETDSKLSVSASGNLWIPVGAQHNLTGDANARFLERIIAGGLAWNERIRWAANAGYLARSAAQLSSSFSPTGNTVGSEVQLGAGARYLALDKRLGIGPEMLLAIATDSHVPSTQAHVVPTFVGAGHYLVNDTVQVGLGVAFGLGHAPVHVFLTAAWAPAKKPEPVLEGGSSFERVVLLPDADGHVGAVEVNDGKHKTLLDKAYQSTEIRRGDDGTHAVQSSPDAVARMFPDLARALPPPAPEQPKVVVAPPPPDKDGDGVPDAADACPDRAGPASPDATRNGCPRTAERVVLLPDDNGHVGAVEIDDGKTKVLLDQAYASNEVGADGVSRQLPADPAEVAQTYAHALAARPPGARMIIYFTANAEPARDLTGPIDSLVAELKEKENARVEVVGHTDELGRPADNVRLGQKRAQLIVDRLIAAGVPKDRVRATSKGSAEPAVRTGGAAEPRNRRVEVFVR